MSGIPLSEMEILRQLLKILIHLINSMSRLVCTQKIERQTGARLWNPAAGRAIRIAEFYPGPGAACGPRNDDRERNDRAQCGENGIAYGARLFTTYCATRNSLDARPPIPALAGKSAIRGQRNFAACLSLLRHRCLFLGNHGKITQVGLPK